MLSFGNGWANGIKLMLAHKKYAAVFAILCAVFSVVYAFVWNMILLRALYVRSDLWNIQNVLLLASTSILSGLASSLLLFSINEKAQTPKQKRGYLALIPAFFASACPSCAPLVLSFAGTTFAVGMAIAKYGTEIRIAALIILIVTILHISSTLGGCKINKRS